MTTKTFRLPDLGEGLEDSEIVTWMVAVGDQVELNQIIAEVETAKALVELPSPFAGRVEELFAEAGSTVAVGAPIVAFEVTDDAVAEPGALVDAQSVVVQREGREANGRVEREVVLVGYGPPVERGDRPTRRERPRLRGAEAPPRRTDEREADPRRRSTPPVRRLAAELGVTLTEIDGSGDGGRVTRDDVLGAVGASVPPLDRGGPAREVRTPIRGVRKATAQAMVASAFTAPQATEFLTVDVTPTVELLARLRAGRAFAGLRLSMLTVVAKALCVAVGRTPEVNSRWDDAAQEIVRFGYVDLGIAVATPRGLVVPKIRDAERMPLAELAVALGGLVETAKAGKATAADLAGGTISITNVGVFGIDSGTPILNPGEAAILAMGAVRRLPWEYRDEVALRQVMTLSCSFDHRLVDGEQASRFLTDVGAILSDPGVLMTMV